MTTTRCSVTLSLCALSLSLLVACGSEAQRSDGVAASASTTIPEERHEPAEEEGRAAEPTGRLDQLLRPERRDWDRMVEDRVVRALVTYGQTSFFLDRGRQRGIAADALFELEKHLNQTLDLGVRKMHVAAIPVRRDEIFPLLEEGRADIAVANLTVTSERLELVDFTTPTTSKSIAEIVVSGPAARPLQKLDDLAGQTVYVRRSSSFWGSLERSSESMVSRGLEAIDLEAADEELETEDILEMVAAGLVPITVTDSHIAVFWRDVFPNLVVHEDLAVAEGGQIAWAVRKDATGLKEVLDPWIEANRQGTLLGNMLLKRYLASNPWVKNATAEEDRKHFAEMVELFRRYGERFDLDPLLVAAQGYQESGLDQSKRSAAGAIGVMQVLRSTAEDDAIGIPDIEELEPNIHAGSKYLRHLIDVYFADPGIDERNRLLFAFAGYNAGPNRINRLRNVAAGEGLDSDRWFRNVELVVAREVGREPVQYVANIYKYYVAYKLLEERRARVS